MTVREKRRPLTATQVARFCDVDLKTIHNWADRGKIRSWRTEGRHLRFRRLDVVDFLRSYGFPIPDALRQSRPRVVLIDGDAGTLASAQRALGRRFDVTGFGHVVDGLLAVAQADPDVVVLGDVAPLEVAAIAARMRDNDATRHVRLIAAGAGGSGGAAASDGSDVGSVASVPRGDPARLREVLDRVTGLD
jgi:excisionase family DNA binding protein